MKKLLTSLFALAVMATASAQMTGGAKARVYAYGLTQSGDDVVTVSFKTNVAATSAKVLLSAEDYDGFEVEATSTDGKNWTAVINPSGDFVADVKYNWSVEVSAPAVTEFAEISDKTSSNFSFYRSFAVAVDNSPESDYFGRAYVANSAAGTARSNSYPKAVSNGLYVFDADLSAINNGVAYSVDCIGDASGYTPKGIYGSTTGCTYQGTSPSDMTVSEDGRIFATTDYINPAKSGVYMINPKTFASSKVYQGTFDETKGTYVDANSNYVGGSACGVGSRGLGTETELYVVDQAMNTESAIYDYVLSYKIGTSNTWSSAPSWSKNSFAPTEGTSSAIGRGRNALDVTKNGVWVAEMRATANEGYPRLFYYSEKTGNREFNSEVDLSDYTVSNTTVGTRSTRTTDSNNAGYTVYTDNRTIGLAVNEELGLVAYTVAFSSVDGYTSNVYARVLDYTENEDGTITINDCVDYEMASQGGRTNALDFDYAGNLYAVTQGNEMMSVYALPDDLVGENTCATPAKKSLTIAYTQGQIEATGVETIGVDNAPVEYYNLQGVKVENPENGIFIKKQGNKAVKVIL